MNKTLLVTAGVAALALAFQATSKGALTITPMNGYNLTWDGNDGDFFDPNPTAPVPNNAALASNGGVAISNGESEFFPTHAIAYLNNGFYGNTNNSHIIGTGGTAPHYMGVLLPSTIPIASIAWGRDNGNGNFDDNPPGTDACGGQCDDRSVGTYIVQVTTDGGTNWTSIATLVYDVIGTDDAPGGLFTEWLRHEYDVEAPGGGPIMANGVRIEISDSSIAIDEIEIYPIPEPSAVALLGLGLLGFALRRRRG